MSPRDNAERDGNSDVLERLSLSRRGALAGLAGAGALGLTSGGAGGSQAFQWGSDPEPSACPTGSGDHWSRSRNARQQALFNLCGIELVDSDLVTKFDGDGLAIDGGTLEATASSLWEDSDDNGLLEPAGAATGIEVTDVRSDNLTHAGTGEVTLEASLDMDGNTIAGADHVEIEATNEPGLVVDSNRNAIQAETDGRDYNGVWGTNTAESGFSWGVRGDTESTDEGAYGVRGTANATSGSPKGVGGFTAGQADGAAGVQGEAGSEFGAVYGVHGKTASTTNTAAGVLGESPGQGANGVMGLANVSDPVERADEAGVYGETGNAPGYGVFGFNTSESGDFAEGVFGLTNSQASAAVTGQNTTDNGPGVKSVGPLEVEGHTNVSDVGGSAYLASTQTIDTDSPTAVAFDATNADHFGGGFNTTAGVYTVQVDGHYHVSFTVNWETAFSAGVNIGYELRINGDPNLQGIQADTTTATPSQRVCRNFSRTLFGLGQGNTLEVVVSQDSGAPADIAPGNENTYLTIYKVG